MDRTLTNAERITLQSKKHGPESISVLEIPKSPFWLVAMAQPEVGTWKLFVCNPQSTTYRLVTETPVSTADYIALWAELILHGKAQKTVTATAKEYRKQTMIYYKKQNKKHNYV